MISAILTSIAVSVPALQLVEPKTKAAKPLVSLRGKLHLAKSISSEETST